VMLMPFVPILLTSLITNLRWLTPVSLLANICMIVGISITYYYAFQGGLPDIKERKLYTTPLELALYFGIAIFAFEGIALVLPLKNTMKEPSNFDKPLGVLNVGMFIVTTMFIFTGLIGYHKWGDDVKGSLTLSLGNSTLAQCVKVIVSCGVLLGYPLQFFIAIQIMWPNVLERSHCSKYPLLGELGFRTLMVILTLCVAEFVPALGLFISLIGSLCSTALALVFPPIIELLLKRENKNGPGAYRIIKNSLIVCLAVLGFATGTYESLSLIPEYFGQKTYRIGFVKKHTSNLLPDNNKCII